MPKCIELLPCDRLISNLCYYAIEQVYLIKWPVSVAGDYFQALRHIIAPAALMVRQQSSLIITLEWEYSLVISAKKITTFHFPSVLVHNVTTEESSLNRTIIETLWSFLSEMLMFWSDSMIYAKLSYKCYRQTRRSAEWILKW